MDPEDSNYGALSPSEVYSERQETVNEPHLNSLDNMFLLYYR